MKIITQAILSLTLSATIGTLLAWDHEGIPPGFNVTTFIIICGMWYLIRKFNDFSEWNFSDDNTSIPVI